MFFSIYVIANYGVVDSASLEVPVKSGEVLYTTLGPPQQPRVKVIDIGERQVKVNYP